MIPVVSKAKAYLKVRHKAVRDALKELQLDGLLLTHSPDLAYLTNFVGEDSVGLITTKGFCLIADFRYHQLAIAEAGWLEIILREASMAGAVVAALSQAKPRRIGYDVNYTTVGQAKALERALVERKLEPGVELVPLENVMANLRKVKDDHEIDLIRKAVGVAEEAFESVRPEIKPGLSENHLAGLLIFELRSRGASDSSFPVIVAAAGASALPHYRPGEALIQRDQPLLFDWGATYKGYCSDLARTLIVGRVSDKIKKIYRVVLEAQMTAINFLRPGVTSLQADRVARDVVEKAGYGKLFGHGLGHGIGREIHELPLMRKDSYEDELRPGMVVTVEPGIYLPGEGGVRIEDDVLITHSGCEVLSSLPKTLEDCHIE
jgi:Xaa-Pro aminopeptidase